MLGWARVTAALALGLTGATALAADLRARDGGPSQAAMLARGSSIEGLALLRPVLSGVLWRAGFKGGDTERDGLSAAQRGALCGAGFSAARYADFGKNTTYGGTDCQTGRLDYKAARSSKPAEVMRAIHAVATNPSKGPVLVHCMWGVHSSGALSAMALVQFCGWSEARAKTYWNETREGAPCAGGCDAWIDAKFADFRPDPALALSAAERDAICPDQR